MTTRMTFSHLSVLLLTATLFGSSFFLIKISVGTIPPVTLAAGRTLLAALGLFAVLRLSGQSFPVFGRAWLPIIVLGVLTAAFPYVAIAWGQLHIASSLGGILFATIPVFSVLIAPMFLAEERLTFARIAGALVGLAGVVIAIGTDALIDLGRQALGATVTIGAALSYATGTIYARLQSHYSPLVLAAGQLLIASVLLIPISLVLEAPWSLAPTNAALLSLSVVALLNTAAPALLMFWLVRHAGASNASLLAFFMPVAAILLGVVALNEPLTWSIIIGFGLILVGAAIVTGALSFRRSVLGRESVVR